MFPNVVNLAPTLAKQDDRPMSDKVVDYFNHAVALMYKYNRNALQEKITSMVIPAIEQLKNDYISIPKSMVEDLINQPKSLAIALQLQLMASKQGTNQVYATKNYLLKQMGWSSETLCNAIRPLREKKYITNISGYSKRVGLPKIYRKLNYLIDTKVAADIGANIWIKNYKYNTTQTQPPIDLFLLPAIDIDKPRQTSDRSENQILPIILNHNLLKNKDNILRRVSKSDQSDFPTPMLESRNNTINSIISVDNNKECLNPVFSEENTVKEKKEEKENRGLENPLLEKDYCVEIEKTNPVTNNETENLNPVSNKEGYMAINKSIKDITTEVNKQHLEKIDKKVNVVTAYAFFVAMRKAYGYSSPSNSMTARERGLLKGLINNLNNRGIHPKEYIEYCLSNWEQLRKQIVWEGSNKSRLGQLPSIAEICLAREAILEVKHRDSKENNTGKGKQPRILVIRKVEDIPKNLPNYNNMVKLFEKIGEFRLSVKD